MERVLGGGGEQGISTLKGWDFFFGVPSVAQRLKNPTRIPEDSGLIPGLTQWVKDLALP